MITRKKQTAEENGRKNTKQLAKKKKRVNSLRKKISPENWKLN